jgi:heme/copper-type cytochrome/quinol oxidase subunit 3
MQYEEYRESRFSLADRVYGSTFFIATGFHGFHVILGTLFLIGSMILVYKGRIIYNHHFSFEFAA